MSLAVYVHIPYCLQRCRYCDFTTFEFSEILPPAEYVGSVLSEIRNRRGLWEQTEIQSLYFGGGTPSLIPPELIVSVKNELAISGFSFARQAEITLEINPATLDEARLNRYLEAGFNRFSVGAQTFHDGLLKLCDRKHSAADTRATLRLLGKYKLNYSFDLLFALPGQSRGMVAEDLAVVGEYSPPHLSAYCLTVPENHPMSRGRAPEREQVSMFELIEEKLAGMRLAKYEISNFAKPGFESRHNQAYWSDQSYWGIGLSSHSYRREEGPWGLRFWNPKSLSLYAEQARKVGSGFAEILAPDQWERLEQHEAMTDFCHMHLRMAHGLPLDALQKKFPRDDGADLIVKRLKKLEARGWLNFHHGHWMLTPESQLISNKVFEELCFLADELRLTPQGANSYCSV